MTVARVRVGDVLRLERRQVQVDVSAEYQEIGVRSFGKGLFHKEPAHGATLGNKRVFLVESGDLVISNVFAWEGAIAVASDAEAGMIGSHRFMTFVPRDGQIDTGWAAWYFRSEPGLELIRRASPGSAGRNRTLAVSRLQDLAIPLPPLDVQIEQASYLDRLDGQAKSTSDALADRSSESITSTLPSLVDEVVRQHTSARTVIGELAELVSDVIHPGDDLGEAATFVGLQHVERHTGRRIGSDSIGFMKGRKFRFRPGDVLYGYLRPYLNKVWVADRHGLCSVDQYVLRPKSSTEPNLLAHILRGQRTLDQAIELTHSLQLPRLRSGLLTSLEVPVVDERETQTVVERLNSVRGRVVALAAARERQTRAVDALVPSALNDLFALDRG